MTHSPDYIRGQRDGLRHAAEIAAAEANKYTRLFQDGGSMRVVYDAKARCARNIAEAIRAEAAKRIGDA